MPLLNKNVKFLLSVRKGKFLAVIKYDFVHCIEVHMTHLLYICRLFTIIATTPALPAVDLDNTDPSPPVPAPFCFHPYISVWQ